MAAHENLSGDQFDVLRTEDRYEHNGALRKVKFTAVDPYMENPVATVTYHPPQERATFRPSSREPGGIHHNRDLNLGEPAAYSQGPQGTLFTHTPAKVDTLAVAPEHQGEGLGTLMATHAIAEHERRFGTRAGLESSKTLTKGSAALATKLSGKPHEAIWGSERLPDLEGSKVEENAWARKMLRDESDELPLGKGQKIDPQPKLRPQAPAPVEPPFPRP
jgi:GNAT superfamily N-acetyltransferase